MWCSPELDEATTTRRRTRPTRWWRRCWSSLPGTATKRRRRHRRVGDLPTKLLFVDSLHQRFEIVDEEMRHGERKRQRAKGGGGDRYRGLRRRSQMAIGRNSGEQFRRSGGANRRGSKGESREKLEGFILEGLGWPETDGGRRSRRGSHGRKFRPEVEEGDVMLMSAFFFFLISEIFNIF